MFTDAVKMQKLYPTTFEIPTKPTIEDLTIGDFCKICAGRERFWVKIIRIRKNKITGIIDNDLVFTNEHGLKDKDVVIFGPENIYSII